MLNRSYFLLLIFALSQIALAKLPDGVEPPSCNLKLTTLSSQIAYYRDIYFPKINENALSVATEKSQNGSTPNWKEFFDRQDEFLRTDLNIPKVLLRLSLLHLPYLKTTGVVVFLSGGPGDTWGPVIAKEAERLGLKLVLVKLPGGISVTREYNARKIPEFSPELNELVKNTPSIFIDDDYVNGGTTRAIQDRVQSLGGTLHGAFAAYDGSFNQGDVVSLYKSGRSSRRFENPPVFPFRAHEWKWKKTSRTVSIDERTLFATNAFGNRLRQSILPQAKALLVELNRLGARVILKDGEDSVTAPAFVRQAYPNIQFGLEANTSAVVALASSGRRYTPDEEPAASIDKNLIDVLPIELEARGNGRLDLRTFKDHDYYLRLFTSMGVLEPVFKFDPNASFLSANTIDTFSEREVELRNSNGGKPLEFVEAPSGTEQLRRMMTHPDSRLRVRFWSELKWHDVTEEGKEILFRYAREAENSYEINHFIALAIESEDSGWIPVLEEWIERWRHINYGWQRYSHDNAKRALTRLLGP